jgi:hypothetical protein
MRGFDWLRHVRPALVPAQLLAGLVLFVLPWIEVRCNDESGPSNDTDKVILQQSGLQAALATYTHHSDPDLATMVRNAFQGRTGGNSGDDSFREPLRRGPFLVGYALALVTGIALSILLWRSKRRRLAVAACCLIASGLLLAQVATGFPLQDSILAENRAFEEERLWKLLHEPSFGEPLAIRGPPLFLLNLTWCLELSLLVLGTTLATLLLEGRQPSPASTVRVRGLQPESAALFETSPRSAHPHCSGA